MVIEYPIDPWITVNAQNARLHRQEYAVIVKLYFLPLKQGIWPNVNKNMATNAFFHTYIISEFLYYKIIFNI